MTGERNCKFSTYAKWWIRKFITESLKNAGTIRIPIYLKEAREKYETAVKNLFYKLGREPLLKEIIAETGFSKKEIKNIRKSLIKIVPLSALTLDNHENLVLKGPPSLEASENLSFLKKKLKEALALLTAQEEVVISMIYGEMEYTSRETALKLGLTRQKITLIQIRAIHKLRNCEQINELAEFV